MLTSAQRNLLTEAFAIEAEEAKEAGAIGYMARVLTQATLPHRDPKESIFKRSNGVLTVTIADVGDVGLPYGSIPRLLLSWVTTEAVLTKSREIVLGDTLGQFMKEMHMVPTGGRWGTITRLRSQMERLFSCAIGYKVEDSTGFHLSQTSIAKEVHLWWDPKRPDQAGIWNSNIVLSKDFFDEIIDRPVPVDIRAIKALKRSPLALDIYTWLTYRMSYLQKPTAISWEQLQMQFGAGYEFSERGRKNFQQAFKRHLKSVLAIYPDARIETARGRLMLKPAPTHIARR